MALRQKVKLVRHVLPDCFLFGKLEGERFAVKMGRGEVKSQLHGEVGAALMLFVLHGGFFRIDRLGLFEDFLHGAGYKGGGFSVVQVGADVEVTEADFRFILKTAQGSRGNEVKFCLVGGDCDGAGDN